MVRSDGSHFTEQDSSFNQKYSWNHLTTSTSYQDHNPPASDNCLPLRSQPQTFPNNYDQLPCHPQAQTKRPETTSGPLNTPGRHPEMSPEPSESTVRQPEILSRPADISVKLSQVSVVVRSGLLHRTANIKYLKEREKESKQRFREYLSTPGISKRSKTAKH